MICSPNYWPRTAANDCDYKKSDRNIKTMATISQAILSDLLYLNIIRPTFTGTWPHREPSGYQVDIGNAQRLGIHNKGTVYNWLRNPPPYFVQSLNDRVELQKEIERNRARSLPKSWHTSGWWFDASGRLTCGSNYANPYRWEKEALLSVFYREQAYKAKIRDLQAEAQSLKDKLKSRTAANDDIYYG